MTVDQLIQFRKNCVNLCLPKGAMFHVKHPQGFLTEFYPGILPRFEVNGLKYNLQYPREGYPYWDVTQASGTIVRHELNCAESEFINELLARFVYFFPYAPEPIEGPAIG